MGGFGLQNPMGMAGMPSPLGGDAGMATPGGMAPQNQMALSALGQLSPKAPQPNAAVMRLKQAYELAHRLIMTSLPQLVALDPKSAKDAHAAARMLLNISGALEEESEIGPPPEMFADFGMPGNPGGGGPPSGPGPGY